MRMIATLSIIATLAGCATTPTGDTSRLPKCLPSTIKSQIAEVERRFGRVTVISSHRPGAIIAGSSQPSYHASCLAIDFKPAKGQYSAVASYLKEKWPGGVGTYSGRMSHIHIDSGPAYRWHHVM